MAESPSQTRISRYIGLYSAESTITHAKSSLRLFLGSALGRKLTGDTLETAGEQYFSERRDYQTDVETFFKSIWQYAPKSINMILSFTKGFLGRNGVKFDEYYWRDLKGKHKGLKGNRALTEDQAPTPEILRNIVQFLPLHGRAFVLALSSSGMRLGEALRLKLSDIDLDIVDAERVTSDDEKRLLDDIRVIPPQIRGQVKSGGGRTLPISGRSWEFWFQIGFNTHDLTTED